MNAHDRRVSDQTANYQDFERPRLAQLEVYFIGV